MRVFWDPVKNEANKKKHGISFEQASALFDSSLDYLEIHDSVHSEHEDRYIAVGPIDGRVVVVVWTEIEEDAMRIISARYATSRETHLYYKEKGRRDG
jgi:uncharacterized protein